MLNRKQTTNHTIFPKEIIEYFSTFLTSIHDLGSLRLTCHFFEFALQKELRKKYLKYHPKCSLEQAIYGYNHHAYMANLIATNTLLDSPTCANILKKLDEIERTLQKNRNAEIQRFKEMRLVVAEEETPEMKNFARRLLQDINIEEVELLLESFKQTKTIQKIRATIESIQNKQETDPPFRLLKKFGLLFQESQSATGKASVVQPIYRP